MSRISCTKCGYQKSWLVRDGYRVCKRCRNEWNPNALPLRLTRKQWKEILRLFVLNLSSNKIAEQTGITKPRILRSLMYVRGSMSLDIPEIFSGTVEVDETYIGGQWKNKRKAIRSKGTKRGKGTTKQPVFGILARKGKVWAEIVDDTSANTLQTLINKKVSKGSTVCSDTWRGYTGIASHGYVHRMVKHSDGQFSNGKGTHINGLEGFWGYLKRQLSAKGGIRRDRLALYLGEYIWRYNHRKLSTDSQVKKLLNLLRNRRYIVG
jgi:transposase-like protein